MKLNPICTFAGLRIAADMFESVNKELLVHPFLQGRYLKLLPDSLKRRDFLATDDHADIRGLVTA